jgi:hypothetical protein
MSKQTARRGTSIRTGAPRHVRERSIAQRIVIAFIAGLLAVVVASAALNWETVTEPVAYQ